VAFIKLQFKPGVNRDQTNYSNEGGWYECDKIRFLSGYPEKIGGWTKETPTPFSGVCRQMWNWITTYGDNLLALGTDDKAYIEIGGYYYNITPIRASFTTPATDNCITLVPGSTVVTVTLPTAHGLTTGSYVDISGVVGPLLGIPTTELNGNHKVTVISPTVFTFDVATTAGETSSLDLSFTSETYEFESISGGMGGTAINIDCEIAPGNPISIVGLGWGTGSWGRDAWGLGATTGGVKLPQRDWWFDNFDNDLVMNIRNGPGYWWSRGSIDNPTDALATRAFALEELATLEGFDPTAVPSKIMQLQVSQNDKHLIAFGAVPFGFTSPLDFDPLLIRWASQDSPGQWTPSPLNTAGDLRVSRGSKIVRALPTRQEILVWTDTNLYTLQFLGTSDVFGLQEYADNISVASPRAMASAANITYWMGQDKFYAYTGRVETLPCTLRNHVFNNINLDQFEQIVCGTNEQWNEVWWFYPTADSSYNNAYVIYNHLERIWYYGSIERTAWLDTPLRQYPQATNTTITVNGNDVTTNGGHLYRHEDGTDDDGQGMVSYIQSSDIDLDDGDKFVLTRRILPDVSFNGSTAATPEVTLQIRPRNFPGSAFSNDAADTQRVIENSVGLYTDQVFMRARARQMAFRIRSEASGVRWQLGAPRVDARPDGTR
jgi:hypothetical protein